MQQVKRGSSFAVWIKSSNTNRNLQTLPTLTCSKSTIKILEKGLLGHVEEHTPLLQD